MTVEQRVGGAWSRVWLAGEAGAIVSLLVRLGRSPADVRVVAS